MKHENNQPAFTLVEILVVIGIIAILAAFAFVYLGGATKKARDTKRLSDLSQIGRFLSFGCPMPDAGPGDYDLDDLIAEYKARYPQYADKIPDKIRDPSIGTDSISGYRYLVSIDNKCALYGNLEDPEAAVSLPAISAATPGGGKGVFQGSIQGLNGSDKFFQVSN